jgi:hypothetical protein
MAALFMVRAKVVDPSVKDAFDRWYEEEHLPDARKAFGARRAWRGWSAVDPAVHHAFYEFDDLARAQAIQGSEGLRNLIAEFDRVWGNKVTRGRDFVDIVQAIDA